MDDLDDLINHLSRTTRLDREEARRVIREMTAYFDESLDQFVVRRHREMQADRLTNPIIFERLSEEIDARRFRVETITQRQLRRMIYG